MNARQYISFLSAVIVFSFVSLQMIVAAFAADAILTDGYTIAVKDPLVEIINFVFSIIAIGGTWVGAWFAAKFKMTGTSRVLFDSLLSHAIEFAHRKALGAAKDIRDPMVKNQMVADAANYVIGKAPTALSGLGITQVRLYDLIRARLPALPTS